MNKALTPIKNQLAFLNDLDGRDKATKFFQYGLKFILHVHANGENEQKLQVLMNQISMARKVFRLFKFMNGYITVLEFMEKTIANFKRFQGQSIDQKINQLLNAIKTLLFHTYLFYDGIGFLGKLGLLGQSGFIHQKNYQGHVLKGFKCWTYANILSVALSAFNLLFARMCFQIEFKRMRKSGAGNDDYDELNSEYYSIQFREGRNFVKSICDLLVSSKFAGYHGMNDGIVGIAGMISSVVGGYDLWLKYQK